MGLGVGAGVCGGVDIGSFVDSAQSAVQFEAAAFRMQFYASAYTSGLLS